MRPGISRTPSRTIALGVLLASLAGCAVPLTAVQQTRYTEAQAFVHDAARTYRTIPLVLHVGTCLEGAACVKDGHLWIVPQLFNRDYFLAVIAHEIGHVVLDHRVHTATVEMEANAKGVEILQRVRGLSQADALAMMYGYLAVSQDPRAQSPGHGSACAEINDLRRRFPAATWLTCMSR